MKGLIRLFILLIILGNPTINASEPTIFFKDIFDRHGSVMLLIHTETGRIDYANQTAAHFYGYTTDELQSMFIQDINTLTPAEVERERRAAATEKRNYFIFQHRTATGDLYDVEVYSYPYRWEGEEYLFSIIQDITPRLQAEKALQQRNILFYLVLGGGILLATFLIIILLRALHKNREAMAALKKSENRYRSLFHNMINACALQEVICDQEGRPIDYRYLEVNGSFARLVGLKVEDIGGRTAREIFPGLDQSWISQCGEVALRGLKIHDEFYAQQINRWIKVAAYQVEPGRFVTIIEDIHERKVAAERLAEKEEDLRITLLSIGDGVIVTGRDGRVKRMNPKAEELTGWSFEDAQNKPLDEIFKIYDSKTGAPALAPIRKVLATGRVADLENDTLLVSRDGTERQIADSAAPIKDDRGNIEGVVLVFSDVTEAYLAKEALRKSEAEKSLILNSIAEFCILFDRHKNVVWMNKKAAAKIRQQAADLKEIKCYNLWYGRNTPCEICPMDSILQTGVPQTKEVLTKTGETILIRAYPVFGDGGRINGFIEFGLEITERKKMEESLKEAFDMLAAMFKNTPNLMSILDQDGRYIHVSETVGEIIGRKPEEIKGETFYDLLPASLVGEFEEALNRLIKERTPFSKIDTIPVADSERVFETWLFPVREVQGEIELIGVLSVDITDRKRDEEHLRYISLHDQLTGLYNRFYLNEKIKRLDAERQYPLSVVVIDINGLKLVNDMYGHNAGDRLLVSATGILEESCRDEDIIARWGGDEFIILLPQLSAGEAQKIGSRIIEKCRSTYVEDIPLSMSLGVASKTEENQDIKDIINKAEDLMYKHKLTESRSAKSVVLATLMQALVEKSFETEEHIRQMQDMAVKVAREINLPQSELDRLTLLVSLHDIGKITIAAEILTKPGPLTEAEWDIIRKHPETGYRITSATAEFAHIANGILSHHEHWDGRGYPQGLKGEDIPLLARITAVVDAFDVMTRGSPYKRALNKEEAAKELQKWSGAQFDPQLVKVFISLLEKGAI